MPLPAPRLVSVSELRKSRFRRSRRMTSENFAESRRFRRQFHYIPEIEARKREVETRFQRRCPVATRRRRVTVQRFIQGQSLHELCRCRRQPTELIMLMLSSEVEERNSRSRGTSLSRFRWHAQTGGGMWVRPDGGEPWRRGPNVRIRRPIGRGKREVASDVLICGDLFGEVTFCGRWQMGFNLFTGCMMRCQLRKR